MNFDGGTGQAITLSMEAWHTHFKMNYDFRHVEEKGNVNGRIKKCRDL